MSTFLQLVNDLRRECSVSGSGVATVIDQTGESQRLVQWIKRAHTKIQEEFSDWKFLYVVNATFSTQTNTNIIQAPVDLKVWNMDRMFDDTGTQMDMVEHADIGNDYIDTSLSKPNRMIINPDNTLTAEPYPDAIYPYTYDYYRKPLIFTIDTDEPLFPEEYHDVILGLAMTYYGNYESAAEIKQQGLELYMYSRQRLVANQLPHKDQFYDKGESKLIQIVAE